jgi:hypothetical protein
MFLSRGIAVQHLKSWYEPETKEIFPETGEYTAEQSDESDQTEMEDNQCRKYA